jgi:lipid-binding SYLF domain-containing protein
VLTGTVDGFLSQESDQTETGSTEPKTPKYITKKIPPRIIQNAVGLAVFSCMRSGLWMSGSGGAGLITARKADGTWSPPSGILLHTAELAFVMGVDIYDCVLVINSVQVLELFTRPRLILGADVSLAVGPLVAPGAQEPEIKWKEISETVLTYVKARGKHQAVQLDGSMVTERGNENERFYCAGITILDILAGNTPKNVPEMRPLFEVIKAAEGRSDYDKALLDWLAQQPAPGDADIESPRASIASPTRQAFGIPDANDPDPFGVIGLEMAGIEIREAGTKLRPTSTQFEYQPSPTSPLYGRFSRQSMDTFVSRSNRGSCMSARTQATATTDAFTQTDVASTADTTYSRANSDDGKDTVERLPTVVEPDEVDYTQVDTSIIERLKRRTIEPAARELGPVVETEVEVTSEVTTTTEIKAIEEKPSTVDQTASPNTASDIPSPEAASERDEDEDADADDEDDEEECDEDEDEDDEPIICEVATASAQPTRTSIQRSQVTQVIQAKGAIVTIPKRIPPPLPARSPARASRGSKSEYGDVSGLKSPVRNSFLSIESRADDFSGSGRASIDEVSAPAERVSMENGGESSVMHMQRPASPRHTKNSSSVCTAVAVDSTTATLTLDAAETSPSLNQHDNEKHGRSASSSAPASAELEAASSAEDDSDREPEPTTPQTAETEFDTASEHHTDSKIEDGVRIVGSSPTPVGSAGERETVQIA